jgi:SAM-dependent methyltransferase
MNNARLYDEQFAKALPLGWEMSVLLECLRSANNLLDVGCGTGRHIVPLAEYGLKVLAIDISREYVMAAKEKLRSRGLLADVDLLVADAQHVPLDKVSFDAAICMGNVLGDVGITNQKRIRIVDEMINAAGCEAIFIIELVHRYWKPKDLLVWLFRYFRTTLGKLFEKSLEYGDYTETIIVDHRSHRLKFHAFTTREAKLFFARKGFHVRVEKRGKFFLDWFILVARHKMS